MKPIEINGIQFDAVIIDNNIELQSINRDIVFENGYILLKDEARNLWCEKGRGFGPADFIAEYVQDNIESWVKENIKDGKEVIHYNN